MSDIKCHRCDTAGADLICDDCAAEVHAVGPEYGHEEGRDEELEDVLEFFKQLGCDAERCGHVFSLSDVAQRLERGEHRR